MLSLNSPKLLLFGILIHPGPLIRGAACMNFPTVPEYHQIKGEGNQYEMHLGALILSKNNVPPHVA